MTNLLLAIAPKSAKMVYGKLEYPHAASRVGVYRVFSVGQQPQTSFSRAVRGRMCGPPLACGEEGGTRTGRGVMASRYQTQERHDIKYTVNIPQSYACTLAGLVLAAPSRALHKHHTLPAIQTVQVLRMRLLSHPTHARALSCTGE